MSELFEFDKKNKKEKFLIGTDEAGRGPLAGPVVAAAVIFKKLTPKVKKELEILNDSKKLSPKKREILERLRKGWKWIFEKSYRKI